MTDLVRQFLDQLSPALGEREANAVLRILLEDGFGINNLHLTDKLTPEDKILLDSYISRLLLGEPVQYITGKTKFMNAWLTVTTDVLIPRQETEELVNLILEQNSGTEKLRVLDIGCGSGCIPIMLALKRPHWMLSACDISKDALAVAARNADLNRVQIHFFERDIRAENALMGLPEQDIIVSNPPYIPFREQKLMPVQVLDHEPALALFVPDDDPLLFYKKISADAIKSLKPGGKLYFECNEFYAVEVLELLQTLGFESCTLYQDLQGKDRMISARMPF